MHSAHTTFVGTPLSQHSLLSGQTWWGPHTWRDPSGNTVNDIHDPHKPSNRRSKVDVSRIFAQHFPKLGPDLTDGTPYTTNLQVFLRPWVGSMNIIRIKNSRVNEFWLQLADSIVVTLWIPWSTKTFSLSKAPSTLWPHHQYTHKTLLDVCVLMMGSECGCMCFQIRFWICTIVQ